jgi:hypothetical protein
LQTEEKKVFRLNEKKVVQLLEEFKENVES